MGGLLRLEGPLPWRPCPKGVSPTAPLLGFCPVLLHRVEMPSGAEEQRPWALPQAVGPMGIRVMKQSAQRGAGPRSGSHCLLWPPRHFRIPRAEAA